MAFQNDNDCFSCEEALKRLDDYVDRELGPTDIEEVKEHLNACKECSQHFIFEQRIIEEVRTKLLRLDIPNDLRQKVLARLEGEPRPSDTPHST